MKNYSLDLIKKAQDTAIKIAYFFDDYDPFDSIYTEPDTIMQEVSLLLEDPYKALTELLELKHDDPAADGISNLIETVKRYYWAWVEELKASCPDHNALIIQTAEATGYDADTLIAAINDCYLAGDTYPDALEQVITIAFEHDF